MSTRVIHITSGPESPNAAMCGQTANVLQMASREGFMATMSKVIEGRDLSIKPPKYCLNCVREMAV